MFIKFLREHTNIFLLLACGVFAVLFSPFLFAVPYLDGNIDFVQSYDFYTGGFAQYFHHWGSVHPPFKLWMTNSLYALFGMHTFSYNLIGLVFGIVGIISFFGLVKTISNKKTAELSVFLFTLSPMFIACSLFSMRDFILTSLLLAALYYYSKKALLLYAVSSSLLLLTKETGVLLPVSILFIELLYMKRLLQEQMRYKKICLLFMPILTFLGWLLFLNVNHQKAWGDWLFTSTASKGTFYTIAYNLFTFTFLNQYAYEQWRHLFILNFNWVFWIIFLFGIILSFFRKNHTGISMKLLRQGEQKTKTMLVIFFFFLSYVFTVLTIQTYTISRYILPLVPCMLLGVVWSIKQMSGYNRHVGILMSGIVLGITILSLFFSIDPLSISIWKTTTVFDQQLYGVNNGLSGNDAITYNMQYLFVAKKRSDILLNHPGMHLNPSECDWLLKDPNNDNQTFHILHISAYLNSCNLAQ